MDAAASIPVTSSSGGDVSSNGNPSTSSTVTSHQNQPPLMVARTPLNVYLKIAIIRSSTDEVVCNDPENAGAKKRVVVSELLDGSLTKVGMKKDEQQNNNSDSCDEANNPMATSADNDQPAATSSSKEDEKEISSSQNDKEASKKEIPVPTITTVPTYDFDIPPTFNVPTSYVRHIRPTYHETQNETVEYNIDVEDENWWRNNKDFGPEAKCKVLIDGKEQIQKDVEGGGQSNVEGSTNDINAMDVDQEDTNSHKQYTIEQVILTNPKYYLRSKRSTQYLLKKYQPKLPLRMMEQMIDIFEKETGFEFTVSLSNAEKVLVEKIPELEVIFGRIDGGYVSDDDDDDVDSHLPVLASPPTLRNVISQVYNYWITKRSKLKKPLLRRYHPVTASNDTNPHMVFRQREQEKRRLRKKRQNDIEAYKKMLVLQHDFEKLRGLCELIVKREEVNEMNVELTNQYFEERLGGWLDTSGGESRGSVRNRTKMLEKSQIESVLNIPKQYDDGPIVKMAKAAKKRKRGSLANGAGAGALQHDSRGLSPVPPLSGVSAPTLEAGGLIPHPPQPLAVPPKKVVVAGHDDGYPAPNFLQPLATREAQHSTRLDGATVPIFPSYENGKQTISYNRFRHRPRLGRGGRIIIDRVPYECGTHDPQPRIITYGAPMIRSGYHVATLGADGPSFRMSNSPRKKGLTEAGGDSNVTNETGADARTAPKQPPSQRLQDLFPKSFLGKDHQLLSRKIEEICARGLMEESKPVSTAPIAAPAQTKGVLAAPVVDETVDEILVPIEDWVEAPNGEIFGAERYVLGPI